MTPATIPPTQLSAKISPDMGTIPAGFGASHEPSAPLTLTQKLQLLRNNHSDDQVQHHIQAPQISLRPKSSQTRQDIAQTTPTAGTTIPKLFADLPPLGHINPPLELLTDEKRELPYNLDTTDLSPQIKQSGPQGIQLAAQNNIANFPARTEPASAPPKNTTNPDTIRDYRYFLSSISSKKNGRTNPLSAKLLNSIFVSNVTITQ